MKRMGWLPILALAGCALGPAQRYYVLSIPEAPIAVRSPSDGRSTLELRRVSTPDYLDSTDLLRRDGRNALKVSPTGRWGERMSVGLAQALRSALARRLPDIAIVEAALSGQSTRQLQIDVEAFDALPDGRCALTARWTLLDEDRRTVLAGERATAIATATDGSDAAVVAAMTDAVGLLADRIARAMSDTPRRSHAASAR